MIQLIHDFWVWVWWIDFDLWKSVNLKRKIHEMKSRGVTQYGQSQSWKSVWLVKNTTAALKYMPRRPRISINWNPPSQTSLHKISEEVFFRLTNFFFRNKKSLSKKQLLLSFLCIEKQKKNWSDPKIFEKFYFWKFT